MSIFVKDIINENVEERNKKNKNENGKTLFYNVGIQFFFLVVVVEIR
jgi:hypothetical protein